MSVSLNSAAGFKSRVSRLIANFATDERAGTAIEYSLLAAMVSVAAIGAMKGLGTNLSNSWNSSSNAIGNSMK